MDKVGLTAQKLNNNENPGEVLITIEMCWPMGDCGTKRSHSLINSCGQHGRSFKSRVTYGSANTISMKLMIFEAKWLGQTKLHSPPRSLGSLTAYFSHRWMYRSLKLLHSTVNGYKIAVSYSWTRWSRCFFLLSSFLEKQIFAVFIYFHV